MRHLYEHLKASGCDTEWMYLPDRGIYGNTHALMMESNSRQIADLICDWLKEHVK